MDEKVSGKGDHEAGEMIERRVRFIPAPSALNAIISAGMGMNLRIEFVPAGK